jgi:RNA-directed DNA polymerase
MTDGQGKSDGSVVPRKSSNNPPPAEGGRGQGELYTGTKAETLDTAKGEPTDTARPAGEGAEATEGRGLAKENVDQQNAHRTQSRVSAPSALDRVRGAARRDKDARFTALFHHITLDVLHRAFLTLKRTAAAGVDAVTWEQYAQDVEGNLATLHAKLHTGAYRAKPSRRVFIPKADGRQRPLGIASLEDKVVQRATVEVLNAIYENDFLGFSYGFRPGRSQHKALDALFIGVRWRKVNWVLDADIRGFFDNLDHGWLMKFVEHRVADKRILRLIQKWLGAGVLVDGRWTETEEGTPQGATISPLLANIYLHYALDLWVHQWRNRHARGEVVIVRYADDFVMGFQHRSDAERFKRVLAERLRRFALELHPEKTRLIEFGRYAVRDRAARGDRKPETFTFLGLVHICSQVRDRYVLRRRTSRKRMGIKLKAIKEELLKRRHLAIPEQGRWLGSVVRGYFAYHAVPTNGPSISSFRTQVIRHWHRALQRRSQRSRTDWVRMGRFARRWIPSARVQHPWPHKRFPRQHPRQEPGA